MKKPLCIISYVIALAVIALTCVSFFSCKSETAEGYSGILRLWNIDCFEGGKGSRASFLKSVAAAFEKAHSGVYIMVSTVSRTGYFYGLEGGNTPDMVSFGIGADFSSYAEKLNGFSFSGGRIGGAQYAYPWCRGGYAVYSLTDNFSDISPENTVISDGVNNIPAAALALSGLNGEFTFKSSTAAYVEFLNGKYKYMLGTQRDCARFAARGKQVYCKVITEYNDLYQYIAVLNSNEKIYTMCVEFINYLLSEKAQSKISDIGMISDAYPCYTPSDGSLYDIQSSSFKYTVGAFTSEAALAEIKSLSERALALGETKNLKNYLKTVA